MVPRWMTWLTLPEHYIVLRRGSGIFQERAIRLSRLLAFYLPVLIWGGYIALTTWYMLKELKRAPDRAQIPAAGSTSNAG